MNGNNSIETNYYYNCLLLSMSELALLHRQEVALKSGGAQLKTGRAQ